MEWIAELLRDKEIAAQLIKTVGVSIIVIGYICLFVGEASELNVLQKMKELGVR
ncbi:hypothetical protein ACR3I8_19790 [Priestia flexa]|uniref:hypothetical protein n=1 Tax=Priestia flexa TaxID=86664 RepID=UPI0015C7D6FF|nr:hypothetical protein [Priestia flexa]USY53590.1 hypothetical protein NIZ91_12565 [Bacillus sp. 1780r2a1]